MGRVVFPVALVAGLLAWLAPARAPERNARSVAELPAPEARRATPTVEAEPAPAPPPHPLLRSYDLRALEGAEANLRAAHAAWIVGGSGGSVDVEAPSEVHAAIEALLAAPPEPLLNDGSDGEFRMRSSSTFDMAQRLDDAMRAGPGVFFNDGGDGDIRSRLENVFDRPLTR